MSSWTEAQKQAIDINGCNMLVSAAAGSGKTAVLTERILKKISSEQDIDRLLIITFTNNAAAEMRERIGQALAEKLEKGQGDTERLCRQQALLSKSSICTIDSFCREVVMRHFTVSQIDSSFTIGDESELTLLRSEVLEELLESYYQEGRPAFLLMADLFAGKSGDSALQEAILSIYDFIYTMPDPMAWLQEHTQAYDRGSMKDFGETVWGSVMLDHIAMAAEELAAETKDMLDFARLHGLESYEEALLSDMDLFKQLEGLASGGSWGQTYDFISAVKFASKKRAAEEDADAVSFIKEKREAVKKSFKNLFALFGGGREAGFHEMEAVAPCIRILSELVTEFDRRYTQEKTENRIMSFSDLEHKALRVLREPAIAAVYREKFQEIYVDEYQDTNELQEAIIGAVSGPGNVFMVGDVKQSIYAFRQACPELFLQKEQRFCEAASMRKPDQDCLVRLSVNFRSRQEVIASVNQVFRGIMNKRTCGTEYGAAEQLYYGASYYDAYPGNFKSELLLCPGGLDQETDRIAFRIRELMRTGFLVYDKELSGQRPITYRDIVILQRSANTTGPQMVQRLQAHGIPVYSPEKGGFFQNYDVNVILSYIRLMDNPLQDIPLLTVLRSALVGFDDTMLAQIRLHCPRVLLYEAMLTMEDSRVQAFLKELNERREKANSVPISQFIWRLITESGYYEYVGAAKGGARRQANLRMLFDRAVAFENGKRKGFFRFINYIERLQQKASEWDGASDFNEGMDVVRVVSIHKSKGLEYPVVFLAGTGRKLLPVPAAGKLSFHKKLGLAMYGYDKKEDLFAGTVMSQSIALLKRREELAEEMRVLYVAMTRAREKLILTASGEKLSKFELREESPTAYRVLSAASYVDWIALAAGESFWTLDTEAFESEVPAVSVTEPLLEIQARPSLVKWQYPYAAEARLPLKMSVSEIKGRRLDWEEETPFYPEDMLSTMPLKEFLENQNRGEGEGQQFSPTQTGTVLHACLERVNLDACRLALAEARPEEAMERLIADTVQEMVEKGYLLQEESAAVDPCLPAAFFLSETGKRMLRSQRIRREVPFTLLKNADEILPEASGKVAVQGIIDCCFLEDGAYVIVDYKSDQVRGQALRERAKSYKTQLCLYKEALEQITGIPVKEKILFFLRSGVSVNV